MTDAERAELLQLARAAIAAHLAGGAEPAPLASDVLRQHAGVFVTLHQQHELRGCIGHVEPDRPLGVLIGRAAVAAATADPRFPPVTAAELDDLTIEISVLGALEPVATIEQIEVGRHGLVVEQGRSRGLLLPQVASEWRWDRETFLAQTCHKAGLPIDAWKRGASVWRFEAEVFDDDPAR